MMLYYCVKETTLYGATVKINEPVGVIGIACPDDYPLLGFVSLFAPAVVRGNAVVIVPSEKYPLLALDLYQVLNRSISAENVVRLRCVISHSAKTKSSASSVIFWNDDRSSTRQTYPVEWSTS